MEQKIAKINMEILKSLQEVRQIQCILKCLSKKYSMEDYETFVLLELMIEKAASVRIKHNEITKVLDEALKPC